ASIGGNHEIFKALMENVSEAVFVIEPCTLCLLDVNQKAAMSLGYSTQEMLELKADCIIPQCDNLLRETSASDNEISVKQCGLIAKDGQVVNFAITIRRIDHL